MAYLGACAEERSADAGGVYDYGAASRDGIGKFYMGREISHVMGHLGAGWLERNSRRREERTDLLLKNLPIEPDSTIVDLGAGTGYFSLPMAKRAPDGRVLAVDIQPEMLAIIESRSDEANVDNIERVLATETDPNLPESEVDLVLIVDAYHEFSHPREVMQAIARSLRKDGRVYLIEYRGEDPDVPIKPLHKMTQKQAKKELAAAGLEWIETLGFLPQQHVLVFGRAD
jgi:ubiquinone/menaquinone biosynthesis C-methylase UbiE